MKTPDDVVVGDLTSDPLADLSLLLSQVCDDLLEHSTAEIATALSNFTMAVQVASATLSGTTNLVVPNTLPNDDVEYFDGIVM